MGPDSDMTDESDRASPLSSVHSLRRSNGKNDTHMKQSARKGDYGQRMDMKLNLGNNQDDDTDDTDDETSERTDQLSASSVTDKSTPRPKARFLRNGPMKQNQKASYNDDDDDRNVFGNATIVASPRRKITTRREDEESDRMFASTFNNQKHQSPSDIFARQSDTNSARQKRTPSSRHEKDNPLDSDDNRSHQTPTAMTRSHRETTSPINPEQLKSRKHIHRNEVDGDNDESSPQTTERTNIIEPVEVAQDSARVRKIFYFKRVDMHMYIVL
jgi:hypothetical protein